MVGGKKPAQGIIRAALSYRSFEKQEVGTKLRLECQGFDRTTLVFFKMSLVNAIQKVLPCKMANQR